MPEQRKVDVFGLINLDLLFLVHDVTHDPLAFGGGLFEIPDVLHCIEGELLEEINQLFIKIAFLYHLQLH
jgi:hypothetical protein